MNFSCYLTFYEALTGAVYYAVEENQVTQWKMGWAIRALIEYGVLIVVKCANLGA